MITIKKKIDIDECSGSNNCHAQATCTNTIGSYTCACKAGYSGNGLNCAGILSFLFFFVKKIS